jgi:hypothetical protein
MNNGQCIAPCGENRGAWVVDGGFDLIRTEKKAEIWVKAPKTHQLSMAALFAQAFFFALGAITNFTGLFISAFQRLCRPAQAKFGSSFSARQGRQGPPGSNKVTKEVT